jgi:hypothetical protein
LRFSQANSDNKTEHKIPVHLRHPIKKPAEAGFLLSKAKLLQLGFFVFHVLASFGIKFHDRHFLGHGFLVFAGRVEVTGTGAGFQLYFFASAFGCHDLFLLNGVNQA